MQFLTRMVIALLWCGAARAAEPTIQLPDGEPDSAWRGPLAAAGVTLTSSPQASVRVVSRGGRWFLEFVDAAGSHTVEVPAPSTEADREAIAWLAQSLSAPLDLTGLPSTHRALHTVDHPSAPAAARRSAAPITAAALPVDAASSPVGAGPAPVVRAPPVGEGSEEGDAASPPVGEVSEEGDAASPPVGAETAPVAPPVVEATPSSDTAPDPVVAQTEDQTPTVPAPRVRRPLPVQGSVLVAGGAGLQAGVTPGASGRLGAGVVVLQHLVARVGLSVSSPTRPTEPVVADSRASVGVWGAVGWEAPWTWAPAVTASCGAEHLAFAQDGAVIASGWIPVCGAGLGVLRALPAGLALGLEGRVWQELRDVKVSVNQAQIDARSATGFDVGLTLQWRSRASSRVE